MDVKNLAVLHPEISLQKITDRLTTFIRKHGFANFHGDDLNIQLNEACFIESGGFVADIYRIVFNLQRGDTVLGNGRVILKAVTSRNFSVTRNQCSDEKKISRLNEILFRSDSSEFRFYKQVASFFVKQSKYLSFRVPTFYFGQACTSPLLVDGFIIIEDLATGNQETLSLIQGLKKGQVEAAIIAIAEFHAVSLTLPQNILSQYPLREDLYLDYEGYDIIPTYCALPETNYFKRNEKALTTFFKRHNNPTLNTFDLKPVLCHNDYWHTNVFFEKTETGEFTNKVTHIIDFQNLQYASGVSDIIRLVFCGVEPNLRRAHMSDWLDLYNREFCAAVTRIAPDVSLFDSHTNSSLNNTTLLERLTKAFEFHRHYEMAFLFYLFMGNLHKFPPKDERRHILINRCVQLFDDLKQHYE